MLDIPLTLAELAEIVRAQMQTCEPTITGALIFSSILSAGGSIAAGALAQPDIPEPPAPPTDEEIAKEAAERKRKIVRSQVRAAQRLAALGPIQLEAPTLGL